MTNWICTYHNHLKMEETKRFRVKFLKNISRRCFRHGNSDTLLYWRNSRFQWQALERKYNLSSIRPEHAQCTAYSKAAKWFDQLMKSKIRSHVIYNYHVSEEPFIFGVSSLERQQFGVCCVFTCVVCSVSKFSLWCVVIRRKNWNRHCQPKIPEVPETLTDTHFQIVPMMP